MQPSSETTQVTTTLFQGTEGLESLRTTWDEIASRMPHRRFFHLWEWHYSCLKWLEPVPHSFRFFLFTQGKTPVAILPLQFTKTSIGGVWLKTLSFPTHNHILLCDLIATPEGLHLPLFQLLKRYLQVRSEPWDLIRLPHLLEDACTIRVFQANPSSRFLLKQEGGSDFTVTTGTYESYIAPLSKNFRRSLKRAKQYLEELPGVQFTFAHREPTLEKELQAFMDVEASGWKGILGTGTAIKLQPNLAGFYRELVRTFSPSGKVSINTLTADGRCIAAQFCLLVDDTAYMLKIGYDENYSRYAPGKHLVELFIKRCIEDPRIQYLNYVTDAEWHADWKPQTYKKSILLIFNDSLLGFLGFTFLKLLESGRAFYTNHLKQRLPRRIQELLGRLSPGSLM